MSAAFSFCRLGGSAIGATALLELLTEEGGLEAPSMICHGRNVAAAVAIEYAAASRPASATAASCRRSLRRADDVGDASIAERQQALVEGVLDLMLK
jgi:hypothetical protein